ncbi:MAG: hypothetical protein SGPRY_014542, partial [Prymnesium sp.]
MNLGSLPRRPLPRAVDAADGGNRSVMRTIRHLLFFATHELPTVDVRLYRHYSRQLRHSAQPSQARLWLLLYQPSQDGVVALSRTSAQIEAGACAWGDGTMQRALPAVMRSAARTSVGTPNPNHRRYFWFHSSLLLWNRTFGYAYANLQYMWRIEPDVLFAGSWSSLVRLTDAHSMDLVLPQLIRRVDQPLYPHWARNKHILKKTTFRDWVYSLVSIGRYSQSFMALMANKWASGVTG